MNIIDIPSSPARRGPVADGPTVRPLLGPDSGAPVAVLHVTVPAGGGMPEHDHGPSHAALIPVLGQLRLRHGGDDHDLGPGTATHIGVGERVCLANLGAEPAELIVVAAPPEFADALISWPTA